MLSMIPYLSVQLQSLKCRTIKKIPRLKYQTYLFPLLDWCQCQRLSYSLESHWATSHDKNILLLKESCYILSGAQKNKKNMWHLKLAHVYLQNKKCKISENVLAIFNGQYV